MASDERPTVCVRGAVPELSVGVDLTPLFAFMPSSHRLAGALDNHAWHGSNFRNREPPQIVFLCAGCYVPPGRQSTAMSCSRSSWPKRARPKYRSPSLPLQPSYCQGQASFCTRSRPRRPRSAPPRLRYSARSSPRPRRRESSRVQAKPSASCKQTS